MKFHKTNQSERGVYRYPVDVPDGKGGYVRTYNVIRPGENGVTEADIATLHRMACSTLLLLLSSSITSRE